MHSHNYQSIILSYAAVITTEVIHLCSLICSQQIFPEHGNSSICHVSEFQHNQITHIKCCRVACSSKNERLLDIISVGHHSAFWSLWVMIKTWCLLNKLHTRSDFQCEHVGSDTASLHWSASRWIVQCVHYILGECLRHAPFPNVSPVCADPRLPISDQRFDVSWHYRRIYFLNLCC